METATDTLHRLRATASTDPYLMAADRSFSDCRQRLISYLVKLNHALNGDLADLSHALLTRFCDSLVDYLSVGHFRVFQRLSLSARSYALIEATTNAGLAFNDRFGDLPSIRLAEVRHALEQMARVLCTRFELEDQLLHPDVH